MKYMSLVYNLHRCLWESYPLNTLSRRYSPGTTCTGLIPTFVHDITVRTASRTATANGMQWLTAACVHSDPITMCVICCTYLPT